MEGCRVDALVGCRAATDAIRVSGRDRRNRPVYCSVIPLQCCTQSLLEKTVRGPGERLRRSVAAAAGCYHRGSYHSRYQPSGYAEKSDN